MWIAHDRCAVSAQELSDKPMLDCLPKVRIWALGAARDSVQDTEQEAAGIGAGPSMAAAGLGV